MSDRSDDLPGEVEVREDPEIASVAVRVQQPMAELDVGRLFGEHVGQIAGWLSSAGATPAGPPYARYFEFGSERADIEFGIPVEVAADLPALAAAAAGELMSSALPAGRRAVVTHVGPYPELGHAYAQLERWIAAHDEASGGPPWESYLLMPPDVGGDASRLRTEVCWPLA